MREVTREIRDLDKDVNITLAPYQGSFDPAAEPAVSCSLLVNHVCMRRDKRCLLAYHRVRSDRLEEMCWNGQDVLDQTQSQLQHGQNTTSGTRSGSGADPSHQTSLSPEEEEYIRQYGDMLAAYKGQWTDIDLTGSIKPPKDLFIDVRVLKDAGEIQTEYG